MSQNPNYPIKCPIWGTMAVQPRPAGDGRTFYDSPRAGGKFSMSGVTESDINENPHLMLGSVDASVKARLTSWLIEQRRLGEEFPEVTCDSIRNAQARRPLRVTEIADNFLRYLAQLENGFGSKFLPPYFFTINDKHHLKALSYLESKEIPPPNNVSDQQITTYIKYLKQKNWIQTDSPRDVTSPTRPNDFNLTVNGYSRLQDLDYTLPSSTQAFMAMWFDPSMDEAWRSGFEPGIRKAGYHPVRIDQKQHMNKIDDEIISEIRRSRFMVADFTQAIEARGNVYYEAGFAHGLGIPVIFTCRTDCCERIQFDIRQYSRIKWDNENLEQLKEDLANRITAILGDGPGRLAS